MTEWGPGEGGLIDLLARAGHGPSRDGLFAVWLLVRVAQGMLPPTAIDGPIRRKRVAALRRRLSSLTLPGPLRKAVAAIAIRLEDGDPQGVALGLQELVASVRETLGPEPAAAVALAARSARLSLDGT